MDGRRRGATSPGPGASRRPGGRGGEVLQRAPGTGQSQVPVPSPVSHLLRSPWQPTRPWRPDTADAVLGASFLTSTFMDET